MKVTGRWTLQAAIAVGASMVVALGGFAGPAQAGTVVVALPTWESRYDWLGADGYAGWAARLAQPDTGAYGLAAAPGGGTGLWAWPTGGREYRPGGAGWTFRAPGTTRIASADVTLAYRSKLYAHHCTVVGLSDDAGALAQRRDCSPPREDEQPVDVSLNDPSASPTSKELSLRVEMPQCANPGDTPCSKWVPALDPFKNGAFARLTRAHLTLVDDDLPVVRASGPLRDLDGRYINGSQEYGLTLSSSDAGAGVERTWLNDTSTAATLWAAAAPCDAHHLTPALGAAICPPAFDQTTAVATAPMTEGAHVFRASVRDLAHSEGSSDAWTVTIDRSAPTSPSDIALVYFDPTTGEAEVQWDPGSDPPLADGSPGSGVDGTEYRFRRTGDWSDWTESEDNGFPLTGLTDGDKVDVEVRTLDAVGNTSAVATTSITVTLGEPQPEPDDELDAEYSSLDVDVDATVSGRRATAVDELRVAVQSAGGDVAVKSLDTSGAGSIGGLQPGTYSVRPLVFQDAQNMSAVQPQIVTLAAGDDVTAHISIDFDDLCRAALPDEFCALNRYEKGFCLHHPILCLRFKEDQKKAYDRTEQLFTQPRAQSDSTKANAFQHSLWVAEMVNSITQQKHYGDASEFAFLHENYAVEGDDEVAALRSRMDLHNNGVGYNFAYRTAPYHNDTYMCTFMLRRAYSGQQSQDWFHYSPGRLYWLKIHADNHRLVDFRYTYRSCPEEGS